MVLGLLLFSPLSLFLDDFIGKEAASLVCYLLSMGVPFWIINGIRKHRTNANTFNFKVQNKRIIPFVIVGSVALLFGICAPISTMIPMLESIKRAFANFASQTGVFSFLLVVIAAPILEELIFRGILLDGLLKKYTPFKAILLSSFLFGFVHLNPWQFVTGLLIGIFSGWVYYKT